MREPFNLLGNWALAMRSNWDIDVTLRALMCDLVFISVLMYAYLVGAGTCFSRLGPDVFSDRTDIERLLSLLF